MTTDVELTNEQKFQEKLNECSTLLMQISLHIYSLPVLALAASTEHMMTAMETLAKGEGPQADACKEVLKDPAAARERQIYLLMADTKRALREILRDSEVLGKLTDMDTMVSVEAVKAGVLDE